VVPVTRPGRNPVTDVPDLRPISPLMVVGPVFVTVEEARTAKLAAVPIGTPGVAALALGSPNAPIRTFVTQKRVRTGASRDRAAVVRMVEMRR